MVKTAVVESRLKGHATNHMAKRQVVPHMADAASQLAVPLQRDESPLAGVQLRVGGPRQRQGLGLDKLGQAFTGEIEQVPLLRR